LVGRSIETPLPKSITANMNNCFVAREIRAKRDMVELDVVMLPSPRIAEDVGGKWSVIAHNLCDGK
jgi:hypothetical protein